MKQAISLKWLVQELVAGAVFWLNSQGQIKKNSIAQCT